MNGHFDFGGVTPSRYFFSIAFVLGLLFAFISGEQNRPFVSVLLQWQLQTLLPMALLIGAHMLLLKIAAFAALNPWIALLISGLVGASLFTPFALAVDFWLESPAPAGDLWRELLGEWGGVAPPVVVAWLALNAPWLMGYRLEKSNADIVDPETPERAEVLPEFVRQLPEQYRGMPRLIKSELHYLKVVTRHGSGLVLYNMADAVDALSAELGIQVHRSYWVAFDAVESLRRRGRQGEILLRSGERVPVSRNRLQPVSEALDARPERGGGDPASGDEVPGPSG